MERDFSITPLLINHQAHPGKNSWVKIFIYEPAEAEVLQTRGTMYAVLSLSANTSIDFTAIMQTILEELHSQYFQQTTGSILQTLEKVLDSIHKKLILMGQEDKRLAEGFNFNLLTAVSWGTVLYFGQLGSSRAALLRNDKLFDIDEGEQKTTNLYLSSGVLHAEDTVILGTNQFFKRFNRTTLKKTLSLPQDKVIAALEAELDPGPGRQNQSAIILAVDIKQVPSPGQEGFRITDPDIPDSGLTTVPTTKARRRNRDWLRLPTTFLGGLINLFKWKIVGFIPVVPVFLVVAAVVALYFSLYGGQDWQPQFGPNQALIASATTTITQAEEVAGVNPDRALDLLSQANDYIEEGLSDYPQNPDLLDLQAKHDRVTRQILIVTELKTQEIAPVNAQPSQIKLTYYDSANYFIDTQKQELIAISLNGQVKVVGSDFRFAQGALLTSTEAGLMVTSRGQAVPINANGKIGESKQLLDTIQPVALTGFAQNGYLLDAAGQIYRIPHQGDHIGSMSTYFQHPIGGSALVDVVVDGRIYLLRQDGTIDVYLNGEKQVLALERASLASGGRALFTSPDSDHLYLLLDSAMVVWNKDGKYIGQYQFASQDTWQMATIDTENNILYAVVNNVLVQAELP